MCVFAYYPAALLLLRAGYLAGGGQLQAALLRAAERRLADKFKVTAERRGGGRQQRGRRWQNGEEMAAEVIEQIGSKATQMGAGEGAGIPVLRSKCRIKDLTASTLEG